MHNFNQKIIKPSNMQESIYRMEEYCGGTVALNCVGMLVDGKCNVDALQKTIDWIINSYDAFALSFRKTTDGFESFVSSESNVEHCIKNFVSYDDYHSWAIENSSRAIDLFKDKSEIVGIVMEDKYGLFVRIHHIISDAWSLYIMSRDFCSVYEQYCNGFSPAIKNNSYVDYLASRANVVSTEKRSKDISYWKEILSQHFSVSTLSQGGGEDKGVGTIQRGTSVGFYDEITEFCSQKKSSPFALVMLALSTYIERCSNDNRFFIGTTILNRSTLKEKDTFGLFVNTSVIPCVVDELRSIDDNLKIMGEHIFGVFRHQSVSYNEILSVAKEDVGSEERLYDVVLNYQVAFDCADESASFELFPVNEQVEGLCIHVNRGQDNSLQFIYNYRRDLYRAWEIECLHNHLVNIIKGIIFSPDNCLLGTIENVSDNERKVLLSDFNKNKANSNSYNTIGEVFVEQVRRYPNKIALVYGNEHYTYSQVLCEAKKIANTLKENVNGHHQNIVIIAHRNPSTIFSILGVTLSGHVFVPVDPKYPTDRISYILKDCAATAVLTSDNEMNFGGFNVINIKNIESTTIFADISDVSHSDLAYIIYTSGTTGRPKGVMVEHEGIVGLRDYFTSTQKVSSDDIVLQFASMSFDAFVSEMCASLLSGATLDIVNDDIRDNISSFNEYLKEHSISFAILPPQFLLQVDCSSLRAVISAGSASNVKLVEKLKDVTFYSNDYGPTEVTVCATHWHADISSTWKRYSSDVPIGKPINNKRIYIVKDGQLCGIGMPGELCIAGDGLARGYLGQPELTAEKFVDCPYEDGKMYRSGDIARWLPDGNISFLGRIDEQVKIRGFRIELGEVETVISEQDGVSAAAVTVHVDNDGEKSICAYYVSEQVDEASLREKIKSHLPAYMMPAYMMRIETMPLTRNGKVDKKRLPKIEIASSEYVAPRTETENIVSKIFGEVLLVDSVGVNDDFFDLGGHSLRAARVINRLEESFGVRLLVRTIFENPTVASLSKLIDEQKVSATYTPIPKIEKRQNYPMSSSQRRTFIINDMQPESVAYNMPTKIIGDRCMDSERVKTTLEKLVERHEILRTSFHMENGETIQRVSEDVVLSYEYEEVAEIDDDEVNQKYKEFVRPFNLGKAPLMRAKVINVKSNRSIMFFDMHHIISDGMSAGILISEFSRIYAGEELAPLRVHYKDYSAWQASRDLSKQEEYWKKIYSDDIPVLDIPIDKPRPQIQSYNGDRIRIRTEGNLREAVEKFSRIHGATEYMVLLSVFMMLLSRYSHQEDVVVGSPVSGRTHADTEKMLGMFVNTLAIRAYPQKGKKYVEFLEEVKQSCIKGVENQEYPFENLVEQVAVERDLSRNPLFDVMFALQNNEETILTADDIVFTFVEEEHLVSKFDLCMDVNISKSEYVIDFEYCTDLFERTTVEYMLRHYINLLNSVLSDAQKELHSYSILDDKEREQVLFSFNDTTRPYPKDKTVVDLIEEQALMHPDSIAIIYNDENITYEELNKQANKLARTLRSIGVEKNKFVAIVAERGMHSIVGILGVLKAGGAYVPIDPNYPIDRIKFMLDDCQPVVMLAGRNGLNIDTDIPVLKLLEEDAYSDIDTNLGTSADPTDLAYVIYTSGTTGQPKGVLIEHKSVMRLLHGNDDINFGSEIRILQTGSISFDASTFEIWMPLSNGGQLILADDDILLNPEDMKCIINAKSINVMWLTSSLFNQLFDHSSEVFEGLDKLLIGGEALSVPHVSRFIEVNSETTLINGYGPTESTTFTTLYPIENYMNAVPIGKPIANTRIYIVKDGQLCGIGMPGELCIAGDGLARGYLGQPELTAEKFVDCPYEDGKMYRSGDIARWLPDGNISFLGRIDEQVKIRGFRIELGEVETVISEQDGVSAAAVTVHVDNDGEKSICAYYVSEQVDEASLREKIKSHLPAYMMPAYMMRIETMPLTRNGKVDKKRLPKIEIASSEYVAPRTETENIVSKIFGEVLLVDSVGVNDDFFDLGGHSLRAARVINRLEESFGVRLLVRTIFENPTVASLSKLIDEQKVSATYTPIPKIEKRQNYPMSSSQRRTFIINDMQPESVAYNMPTKIIGDRCMDSERVKTTLEKLVERHEILRTSFHMENGETIQRVSEDVVLSYEYEEVAEIDDDEVNQKYKEFVRPFNLGKAPLMRAKVINVKSNRSIMFFDMHHIISDGMSAGILISEFSRIYAGEELAPLRVHYKDYSAWQASRDLSKQEEYWKKIYSDDIPVLDIPIDKPRPQIQSYNGDRIRIRTEGNLREAVEKFSRIHGATEYMVLLSVFMMLLSRYSHQEDVVVGSPVSGRTHADTEKMLGMFVNTLAIRAYPQKGKKYVEFLEEVKQSCIKGVENQEYPFENLVEQVAVERDLSRNPLFDVMFALQNNEETILTADDIVFTFVEEEHLVSKFDLCMDVNISKSEYVIDFEYCTDLFERTTVEYMLRHYINLLNSVLSDAQKELHSYSILDDKEREQVLFSFNDTTRPYPKDKTVVDLIEEQALMHPDSIAIIYNDENITYEELNKQANKLARTLRSIGVEKNKFVAIVAERGMHSIVGILGVLKAGGAYVPIDPNYPIDRIKFMLDDCQPVVMLAGRNGLNIDTDIPVLKLLEEDAYSDIDTNLGTSADPTDLAYVIYTSGTTGQPKGVLIEHLGLSNLLVAYTEIYHLTRDDTVLQAANMIFDQSVWDIFNALAIGGKLCLVDEDVIRNPSKLGLYCTKQNVTVASFTPVLINELKPEEFGSLRIIDSSGEAANIDVLKLWADKVEVINTYGPTETTVNACSYTYRGNVMRAIPIGKPIANTQMYILNCNQVCGVGEPGELCITGDGVGRGYLNRDNLTNEKFVPNPFGKGLMYRTGDLCRWCSDGNVDFLGRIDDQVKIRGYRIELGDIVSAFRALTDVKDAAVIIDKSDRGVNDLFAYFTSDKKYNISRLRSDLKKILPKYMVPAYITQVEKIPITRSGKLDRKALACIKPTEISVTNPPKTETEKVLASVMCEVIGVPQIDVDESFFDAGGDSIKAIKVISAVATSMNVDMMDFFSGKTVREMCADIDKRSGRNVQERIKELINDGINCKQDSIVNSTIQAQRLEYLNTMPTSYVLSREKSCLQTYFITGCTGYLGIHILHELSRKRDNKFVLLLRGESIDQATERLQGLWEYYFGTNIPKYVMKNITIFVGELSGPLLGLNEEQYKYISSNVSSIINCAANVSHYARYESAYADNVISVKNLIELMSLSGIKTIHHISTISVSSGTPADVFFSEDSTVTDYSSTNVYIRTKIEAENLLDNARNNGIRVFIYRVGDIQCQYQTGVFQRNIDSNAFISALKALTTLGVCPIGFETEFDYAYVDDIASACVALIDEDVNLEPCTYHVIPTKKLSLSLVIKALKKKGYSIKRVFPRTFLAQIEEGMQDPVRASIVSRLLVHSGLFDLKDSNDLEIVIGCDRTNSLLKALGFEWKDVDGAALVRMIEHLESKDYLQR